MTKRQKLDELQQKFDRVVKRAEYIIRFHTDLPDLYAADPKMPPSEIDDILEGLDR